MSQLLVPGPLNSSGAAFPIEPLAGRATFAVLNHWVNALLFDTIGPRITTRWPSPPPVRSAPETVVKLMPAGAPLANVPIADNSQPSNTPFTTRFGVNFPGEGSWYVKLRVKTWVRSSAVLP